MPPIAPTARPDSPSSAASSTPSSPAFTTYSLNGSSTSSLTASDSSIPDLESVSDSDSDSGSYSDDFDSDNSDFDGSDDSDSDDSDSQVQSLADAIGLPPLGIPTDVDWTKISFRDLAIICSPSHIYYLSYVRGYLYLDCIHVEEAGPGIHPRVRDIKGREKVEGLFHCPYSRVHSIVDAQIADASHITNAAALYVNGNLRRYYYPRDL